MSAVNIIPTSLYLCIGILFYHLNFVQIRIVVKKLQIETQIRLQKNLRVEYI